MSAPFRYPPLPPPPPPANSKISLSLVDQRGEDEETHTWSDSQHYYHHRPATSSLQLLASSDNPHHHQHSSENHVGRTWDEHSPDLPPEIQAAYRDARARGLPPGWTCTIDVRSTKKICAVKEPPPTSLNSIF
jgi:hypothetical protein